MRLLLVLLAIAFVAVHGVRRPRQRVLFGAAQKRNVSTRDAARRPPHQRYRRAMTHRKTRPRRPTRRHRPLRRQSTAAAPAWPTRKLWRVPRALASKKGRDVRKLEERVEVELRRLRRPLKFEFPTKPSSPNPARAGGVRAPRKSRDSEAPAQAPPAVVVRRGGNPSVKSVVNSDAPPRGPSRWRTPVAQLPETDGFVEVTCRYPNPHRALSVNVTSPDLPLCAYPNPGFSTQHLPGGSLALNGDLENRASSIAAALQGAIQIIPGPPGNTRSGCLICTTGKYTGGVMFTPPLCGYTVHTACVGANLVQTNAERGSSLLHEVMHMYMRRLYEAHFSKVINMAEVFDPDAYCGTSGPGGGYFNEQFTDCLAQARGAVVLNYRCPAELLPVAHALLAKFPPTSYPWAPPPPPTPQAPANPPSAGSRFVPLPSPQRLFDSRTARGKIIAGEVLQLQIAGHAGIPGDASGVVLNIAITDPEAPGYITVFPGGAAQPTTSNQNFQSGDTFAGSVFAALGGGKVNIFTTSRVHIIVDATAYMSTSVGDYATSTPPFRMIDTRNSGGPIDGGTTRLLAVVVPGVPSDATGIFVNIAATGPQAAGFLTLYPPSGDNCNSQPATSSLNFAPGQTIANSAVMPIRGMKVCVFSSARVDFILDVNGFLSPSANSVLFPIVPQRLLDTRPPASNQLLPSIQGRLAPLVPITVSLVGLSLFPSSTTGVALSVTIVDAPAPGYVVAYPGPCNAGIPNVSIINYVALAARPNLAVLQVGSDLSVCIAASTPGHIIVDVAGYFLPR